MTLIELSEYNNRKSHNHKTRALGMILLDMRYNSHVVRHSLVRHPIQLIPPIPYHYWSVIP